MSTPAVHFRVAPTDKLDLIFDFTDLLTGNASLELITGTPTAVPTTISPDTGGGLLAVIGAVALASPAKKCIAQVDASACVAGEKYQLRVTVVTDTNGVGGTPRQFRRDFILACEEL